jgi:predicted regulator of amino acid metabolism with ACT domain
MAESEGILIGVINSKTVFFDIGIELTWLEGIELIWLEGIELAWLEELKEMEVEGRLLVEREVDVDRRDVDTATEGILEDGVVSREEENMEEEAA